MHWEISIPLTPIPPSPVTQRPPCASPTLLQMEGVQPALTYDDVMEAEAALKKNVQFLALMADRFGITDMEQLAVDPW